MVGRVGPCGFYRRRQRPSVGIRRPTRSLQAASPHSGPALSPTPDLSSAMHDPRIDQLADLLLDHSCRIEKGEKVLIEAFDLPDADARVPAGRGGSRARGRAARVVEVERRAAVALPNGDRRKHEAGRRARKCPHGEGAGVHRRSRRGQQQPVCRRAAREDGPLPGALVEDGAHRRADRQDEVGRAPLSDRFVRPGGQHEHAGVRGFLFRRLHGRLRRDAEGPGAAGRADASRPTACGSSLPAPSWSSRSRASR